MRLFTPKVRRCACEAYGQVSELGIDCKMLISLIPFMLGAGISLQSQYNSRIVFRRPLPGMGSVGECALHTLTVARCETFYAC